MCGVGCGVCGGGGDERWWYWGVKVLWCGVVVVVVVDGDGAGLYGCGVWCGVWW